jgi:hypothetical protein
LLCHDEFDKTGNGTNTIHAPQRHFVSSGTHQIGILYHDRRGASPQRIIQMIVVSDGETRTARLPRQVALA